MPTLPDLLCAAKDSANIAELRARLFPDATQFFGALRGALFVLDEVKNDARFGQNPFAKALSERHAPLHDGQIESEWQARRIRDDHGHLLAGPLVLQGELVGILGFTRLIGSEPFTNDDIANLSALCLHVSTRMASWTKTLPFDLTPREREIAALVAQGKTNAQIGRELWVSGETVKASLKTMFRKTGVSSRAQLVAVLPPVVSS